MLDHSRKSKNHSARTSVSHECGAALVEYLLLAGFATLIITAVIKIYQTPVKVGVIQTACIVETGGGTVGTTSDQDGREGFASPPEFQRCVEQKLIDIQMIEEES